MPRQTEDRQFIVPDGFRLEIKPENSAAYVDIGVLTGGGTLMLTWEDLILDGGNHPGVLEEGLWPVLTFDPSPIINFDPSVIETIFNGIVEKNNNIDGEIVDYIAGSTFRLRKATIRLTHYTNGTDYDWRFILYNATLEGGGRFSLKGRKEQGTAEIQVSFTGRPDPKNMDQLFSFYKSYVLMPFQFVIGEKGVFALGDPELLGDAYVQE